MILWLEVQESSLSAASIRTASLKIRMIMGTLSLDAALRRNKRHLHILYSALVVGLIFPVKDPYIDPLKEPYKDPLKDPYKDPLKEPYEDPLKDPHDSWTLAWERLEEQEGSLPKDPFGEDPKSRSLKFRVLGLGFRGFGFRV